MWVRLKPDATYSFGCDTVASLRRTLMRRVRRASVAIAVAALLTLGSARARTIEFDAATIADLNAAFDAGTLTSE